MGALYDCEICGDDQVGEFQKVNGEHICADCEEKAISVGIKILKTYKKSPVNPWFDEGINSEEIRS